ncbi:hypothetical protein [Burkholderia sp. BCC0044]|uniref:hypothetical protein n=1 Tax=Burkholderia sp. BCC0044 TaxID=2676295 RepID=UPI00158D4645|nr:hypothetical protein [Burkholderia sp. BCC0044]
MQDITGRFALPLVTPFSDVPPPYGRRSSAYVKSRRPALRVFDLCPHGIARDQAKACAEDFGSGNRAWLNQHPPPRSWRRMLAIGLAFAASCSIATHLLESRPVPPSPDTVYRGAISIPSAPVPARVAAVDDSDSRVADVGTGATALPERAVPHHEPVLDTVVPKAVMKSGKTRGRAQVQGARANGRANAEHSVPTGSVAEAIGMTDAEFAYWREVTLDRAFPREPHSHPDPAEGGLYFNSVEHPRLIRD